MTDLALHADAEHKEKAEVTQSLSAAGHYVGTPKFRKKLCGLAMRPTAPPRGPGPDTHRPSAALFLALTVAIPFMCRPLVLEAAA